MVSARSAPPRKSATNDGGPMDKRMDAAPSRGAPPALMIPSRPAPPPRYKRIRKPFWTPPNWLFGPVWTLLYGAMGVASWLVYQEGGFAKQAVPLSVYAIKVLPVLFPPPFPAFPPPFPPSRLFFFSVGCCARISALLCVSLAFVAVIQTKPKKGGLACFAASRSPGRGPFFLS